MAVILRSGMSRTTTATSSVPIRSSTVWIKQSGSISKIESEDKIISVVNLGYQGDHRVSRLWVKLEDRLPNQLSGYKPAIVFYNEKNANSYTLSMESIADTGFYVDIPQDITQYSGNYQMHFLLKEEMSTTIAAGGNIGENDDPAYQEIFVSDSWKGVIDGKSGFVLMPQKFDWETQLYNYSMGSITPSTWRTVTEEQVGGDKKEVLTSTIYLGGFSGSSLNDIVIQPEDLNIRGVYASKTLTLTIDDVTVDEETLDKIVVKYPVVFNVNYNSSSGIFKTPIQVEYNKGSINITNANRVLGVKYDAYVTPINVTQLVNLPTTTTTKYIIFSKDEKSLVCEAKVSGDNVYGWIPAEVTGNPGMWEVSFVVRGVNASNELTHSYYTGIVKLPVTDNKLVRKDLAIDTEPRALSDVDGKALYDSNAYALLATTATSSEAHLTHSADTINTAIGWVAGVYENQVSATQVVTAIGQYSTLSATTTNLQSEVEKLKAKDTLLENSYKEKDTEIDGKITEINQAIKDIENEIETLDVTLLKEVVDGNTKSIKTLNADVGDLKAATTELQNKDKEVDESITSLEEDVEVLYKNANALQDKVGKIDDRLKDTEQDLIDTKGRVALNEEDIVELKEERDRLAGRTKKLEDLYTSQSKLIVTEISERGAADENLQKQIDDEVETRTQESASLQTQITDEVNARVALQKTVTDLAEKHDKELQDEITSRSTKDREIDANIGKINTKLAQHEENINSAVTDVNYIKQDRTIIRNDYDGVERPFVATIVVLQPLTLAQLAAKLEVTDLENLKQELLDAEIITIETDLNNIGPEQVMDALRLKNKTVPGTLYLIQEEEE